MPPWNKNTTGEAAIFSQEAFMDDTTDLQKQLRIFNKDYLH